MIKNKIKKFKTKKKELNKNTEKTKLVCYRILYKITRNNVFILIYNPLGKCIFYSSGGLPYRLLMKKSVDIVNILIGNEISAILIKNKIYLVDVEVVGLYGSHCKYLISGLEGEKNEEKGVFVRKFMNKTPIAHNGCDRKRRRRKSRKRKFQ